MKIFYTVLITVLFSIGALAQQGNVIFDLNFRDATVINQVLYADSAIDSLGVWQIGTSGKAFFDSSYGIVTLLDSLLPPNTNASFIITLPSVNYLDGGILTFTHKYDIDSAHGGAYVEFSVDRGQHWQGVYYTGVQGGYYNYYGYSGFCVYSFSNQPIDGQFDFPPTWWGTVPKDTTSAGIAYFTGSDSVWIQDTIVMPTYLPEKTNIPTQFMFRFTAFTDSSTQAHAGWMIDSIKYTANVMSCLGGINEINSSHLKVYPDPATDVFYISLLDLQEGDYSFTLYDIAGRAMRQENFSNQELAVQRNGLSAGCYFIQVADRRTQATFQKRIVLE